MRAKKVKYLRRMYWSALGNEKYNGITPPYKVFKRQYKKGIPLGLICFYPREGRNVKELMRRTYWEKLNEIN